MGAVLRLVRGARRLDRDRPRRRRAALRRMVASGAAAAADGPADRDFPRGHPHRAGPASAYQPGVAALYQALGVPLVPAAVNSGLFWGRRSFLKRPGRITLEFLEPIPPGLPRRS